MSIPIGPLKNARRKAPHDAQPGPALYLADVEVTWQEGGETRRIPGAVVASCLHRALARHPCLANLPAAGFERDRVGPMLRGLSALLFPDAGEPHEALEHDQRFLVSQVLADAAASIESADRAGLPALFRIERAAPEGGR